MTGTKTREYQDLERESSDHLLERDSRWVLGRYEESAYHALQAARARSRMGHLCFASCEYPETAEDWLSAADCFLLASADKQATAVLDLLHGMEETNTIPGGRPDLVAALRERDQELKGLREKIQQFHRALRLHGHEPGAADETTLSFLLGQRRELPGDPLLHYAIFSKASGTNEQPLADKHLVWAATFAPDNANLTALLGYLHVASGRLALAIELGSKFLNAHSSDTGPVRIMLACAHASGAQDKAPDQGQALEILVPVLDGKSGNTSERIAALALSAAFQYELGREEEFAWLVGELDRLEKALQPDELPDTIADFRALIPHPERNGTGEAHPGQSRLLPEGERQRLFQKARLVSIRPLSLAE